MPSSQSGIATDCYKINKIQRILDFCKHPCPSGLPGSIPGEGVMFFLMTRKLQYFSDNIYIRNIGYFNVKLKTLHPPTQIKQKLKNRKGLKIFRS